MSSISRAFSHCETAWVNSRMLSREIRFRLLYAKVCLQMRGQVGMQAMATVAWSTARWDPDQ